MSENFPLCGTGPGQRLGTPSPYWVSGIQALGPSSVTSQVHSQETGSDMKEPVQT